MRGILVLGMVVSLSFWGCSGNGPGKLNESASLVGQLPAVPLQWKIITSMIDRSDSTMSTLYGNDLAVEYIRTHSQHAYPPGSVLSLVTWAQREDPRWFGARIPGRVTKVEFVTVGATAEGSASYSYKEYEGTLLKESSTQESVTPNERSVYLLSQRAAVMP